MQNWAQSYDPLGSPFVSTLVAAIPVGVLLGAIASGRIKAHVAALLGLAAALLISIFVVKMPTSAALAAAGMGAAFGLLPIGWIVFNTIFLYQITKEQGAFDRMQAVITSVSTDRRVQLLLIAFALGSFFEGAAGFGTPVAITGAILLALGFSPFEAAAFSLIANTAPVAFGSMGTPIIALSGVTGIDMNVLSKMVGRQLPFFSVIVPFWLIWAYDGRKGVRAIWPTLLVSGFSFAIPQWLMSNLHGPTLVDVVSGAICVVCTALFARSREPTAEGRVPVTRADLKAWLPWAIMSVFVFIGGFAAVKAKLNAVFAPRIPVPFLDGVIQRVPPVVAAASPEPAIYTFNILSATGTWMLLAAVIGGLVMGVRPLQLLRIWGRTLAITWASLLTIVAMMSIGYVTRYSGLDAILGLAFAKTGFLYPLFGTMLGWLGVALTGSDTSSNVLFGSLQKITSEQLGLSPVLMASANSSGGVMGKMIDAQSIVVASTATRYYGHEGKILRFVFWHSVVLALLVGLLVMLQAYVPPFTSMVPSAG